MAIYCMVEVTKYLQHSPSRPLPRIYGGVAWQRTNGVLMFTTYFKNVYKINNNTQCKAKSRRYGITKAYTNPKEGALELRQNRVRGRQAKR